ncbi:MAG: type VI secretion system baseplate subunit TssE [Pirellulaceae bacterium]|nr:type VI secretion system baseplate subunit TssE [Pirellulaceae bacterium]
MHSLTPDNRLQPSLLDRLRDDEPFKEKERPEQQVLNLKQLREVILRDLALLLNCDNMETVADLSHFPDVKNSVLNFGIPSFSGSTSSSTKNDAMVADVKEAILKFEPRIIPNSLAIQSVPGENSGQGENTFALQIEGKIWAQPFPLEFLLRSELDLETGNVIVEQI